MCRTRSSIRKGFNTSKGMGSEVRYSPLLRQKSFHHICQQARIVRSRFSQLPLAVTPPVWSGLNLLQRHWSQTDGGGGHRWQGVTRRHSSLQGLIGVEELQMPLRHQASPSNRRVAGSPVHSSAEPSTAWKQEQLNEIKLTENRRTLIVFSWLFLSIVLVWQHEFM